MIIFTILPNLESIWLTDLFKISVKWLISKSTFFINLFGLKPYFAYIDLSAKLIYETLISFELLYFIIVPLTATGSPSLKLFSKLSEKDHNLALIVP